MASLITPQPVHFEFLNIAKNNRSFNRKEISLADISVKIAGLKFENPLFAASGSATNCGEKIRRIALEGKPGGITTKSVSVDVGMKWGRGAKQPTPLCWPWDHEKKYLGMVVVCAKGEVLTCEDWFEREIPKAKEGGVPIIASVSGAPSIGEWTYLASSFEKVGASMVELNFGTPHARAWGHGSVLLYSGVAEDIVRILKETVEIPIMAKLPYLTAGDCITYGNILKKAGIDALKVCMPPGAMVIDIETGLPPMGVSTKSGILAGPPHKPLALYNTYILSQETGLPIIGSGGIRSYKDVIEFIMAGASGVEICSWMMIKGPQLFAQVNAELSSWMDQKGYSAIRDFQSISQKYSGVEEWSDNPYIAIVDVDRCNGCGQCETICYWAKGREPASAIRVDPLTKKAVVDPDKCEGCGYCYSHCMRAAISLEGWGRRDVASERSS